MPFCKRGSNCSSVAGTSKPSAGVPCSVLITFFQARYPEESNTKIAAAENRVKEPRWLYLKEEKLESVPSSLAEAILTVTEEKAKAVLVL